jgi:hypothetical protein
MVHSRDIARAERNNLYKNTMKLHNICLLFGDYMTSDKVTKSKQIKHFNGFIRKRRIPYLN